MVRENRRKLNKKNEREKKGEEENVEGDLGGFRLQGFVENLPNDYGKLSRMVMTASCTINYSKNM